MALFDAGVFALKAKSLLRGMPFMLWLLILRAQALNKGLY